jgi:hypothetical protein
MRRIEPSSVIASGLVGGVAVIVAELLLAPSALPMMAALVLGEGTRGALVVALAVTFALSIAFAALLDLVCRTIDVAPAVLLGVPFGIALYILHCQALALVFPSLRSLQDWGMFFAYQAYGLATAATFQALHLRYAHRHGIPVPEP